MYSQCDNNTDIMGETQKSLATELAKRKSKMMTWKVPSPEKSLVVQDGKILVMKFDQCFQPPEKARIYNNFYIKKGSYENQLELICKYLNFFFTFYDQEHELMTAYLKIKHAIDKLKLFNKENTKQLIDLIYEILFTESIQKKIDTMVEENYVDDIEGSEEGKKYATREKKHLESLEFTNQHIKILLKISFGMKCIAPIMLHYAFLNQIKISKNDGFIYPFYEKLFTIFSENCNMYNKLFVYVKAKVLESKSRNSPIYDQRDILGTDVYNVIELFLKDVVISENMVKYNFPEHFDKKIGKFKENIIGFNKTIIKYQLSYFIKYQYSKNLTEVTSEKNTEGLSGVDKMSMNQSKIDEGVTIISRVNAKLTLQQIIKDNDFGITEEEIDYYIKNHKISKFQSELIYNYWTKEFGVFRDTRSVTRRDYILLALILKKRLLMQAGYVPNGVFVEDSYLPYILTGNLQEKVSTRTIRNSRFTNEICESYLYEKLRTKKYKNLMKYDPNYIIGVVSPFMSTVFTYVAYENPEALGKEIECDEYRIADEILFFLDSM